ncbi:FapA family protein [Fictibacillus nanhaiensis]|uniref:DUF342 domain-containing protein n=1 Tax=Fictibacillus nanhaiensis TaxID=742169 RepID=UPI001C93D613|nr:FapA family protein [Fictibacillus nanhaiensis]MBY6036067.1 FapA family protein [Fictibacillus nanhaiensis]
MDRWFTIKTKEKDTIALLFHQKDRDFNKEELTFEVLSSWIASKKIQHGVKNEILYQIVQQLEEIKFPVEFAYGKLPVDGEPAELIPVVGVESARNIEGDEKIDFKRLFTIPTVSIGQLLARKKSATQGIEGISVYGTALPAKKGKELLIKNGDNTVFNPKDFGVYAAANGEVSFRTNCVHVYPVYKVEGDLSLKTGHIDFVGNVHVTGNVPSGFKINAQGDIRIEGLVEAADIATPGNIVISGGVLGQGKGSIRCGGNFTSLYINQGNVVAGESIEVAQTILHSTCEAGKNIICLSGKGNIAGGSCAAGHLIKANEIGNETYSKTFLYMNAYEADQKGIAEAERKIAELENGLSKLQQLKDAMLKQATASNRVDQGTITKIENTISKTFAELKECENKKNNLVMQEDRSHIIVKETLHPNVEISIGKYKRKVQSVFQTAKVFMEEKEIVIHSL